MIFNRTKSVRARPARGTLALIGGLLIASALIRVGNEANRAMALDTPKEVPDEVATQTHDQSTGTEIQDVLDLLKDRKAKLDKREADMRKRMSALAAADAEIDRKMKALVDAEDKLRATLAIAKTAAEDDLGQLTTVYENMKPKQAAALFEAMEPQFSAGFLGRMKPAAAASVMAGLTPETAYAISVILAGRNANVPKE